MNPSPLPAFVKAARHIALRVLKDVAPEEESLALELLGPLIESAHQGAPLPLDLADESGRFGVGDWTAFLLAPLVVETLQRLQRGEPGMVTVEAVQTWAKRLGMYRSRSEAAAIAASLNAALSELTSGNEPSAS